MDYENVRQTRKPNVQLSASETLNILNKQWLDTTDIMKICNVGINKARNIASDVMQKNEKIKSRLPSGVIPADIFIEYFGIDLDYLFKIVEIQKKSMSLNDNSKEHTIVNNPSNLFT